MAREGREVDEIPDVEQEEVRRVFRDWGLSGDALEAATNAICADKERWVRFMMKEELGLSEPHPARARLSAATIGGSYVAGGAIPLAPYLFHLTVPEALLASVAVTMVALGLFGGIKGRLTGRPPLGEAARTMLVGALASGAAYALARLISG
jgi:VIT1/CCC1 family predicted Fe2+/Mn2+ transporter